MKIGYGLKILKLVLVILNTSYFVGVIFLIMADVSMSVAHDLGSTDQEFFIEYNSIDSNSEYYNTLLLIYFAFTSLSTVGFGDLNPRSNFERIFVAFMLLFGVAIFSYIMGVFIEILQQYQAVTAAIDDYEKLSKFFGLMKHFNKGRPINDVFKDQIEIFFSYKWVNDHN